MSDAKYHTRYGIMTAKEAALDLLDRSQERVRFLEEVFKIAHQRGVGFTLPGYTSEGLAAILEDIGHDVTTARDYYCGDDSTPGKEYDLTGVQP